MPRFCGIYRCGRTEKRDGGRYFLLPQFLSKGSDLKKQLTVKRRQRWLDVIKRADITEAGLKYLLVCDQHFNTGAPSDIYDVNNPDWAPNQQLGYGTTGCTSDEAMGRYQRAKNRKKLRIDPDPETVEAVDVTDFVGSSTMVRFCGIINCGNEGGPSGKSFFRLPSDLSKQKASVEKQAISTLRREKWLNAINRDDLTETKKTYLLICEDHFISRKPAALWDKDNPDWVPSLNLGYDKQDTSASNLARFNRVQQRTSYSENPTNKSQRISHTKECGGIVNDYLERLAKDKNAENNDALLSNSFRRETANSKDKLNERLVKAEREKTKLREKLRHLQQSTKYWKQKNANLKSLLDQQDVEQDD